MVPESSGLSKKRSETTYKNKSLFTKIMQTRARKGGHMHQYRALPTPTQPRPTSPTPSCSNELFAEALIHAYLAAVLVVLLVVVLVMVLVMAPVAEVDRNQAGAQ
jgi:hypothetical protein